MNPFLAHSAFEDLLVEEFEKTAAGANRRQLRKAVQQRAALSKGVDTPSGTVKLVSRRAPLTGKSMQDIAAHQSKIEAAAKAAREAAASAPPQSHPAPASPASRPSSSSAAGRSGGWKYAIPAGLILGGGLAANYLRNNGRKGGKKKRASVLEKIASSSNVRENIARLAPGAMRRSAAHAGNPGTLQSHLDDYLVSRHNRQWAGDKGPDFGPDIGPDYKSDSISNLEWAKMHRDDPARVKLIRRGVLKAKPSLGLPSVGDKIEATEAKSGAKTASILDKIASKHHVAAGALGGAIGYEILRRANEDRKLGRMIRRQQQTQQ